MQNYQSIKLTNVKNRILALLPPTELEQLAPDLEEVPLRVRDSLYEINETIKYAWFVNSGVVSLLAAGERNNVIEVATVGNEGMVGLPLFLDVSTHSIKAFCQIAGTAMRLSAHAFKKHTYVGSTLYSLLQQYTYTLMAQMAQTAACNRTHAIDERCSRWLLMTHDRVEKDEFMLTQEFLATMLGVRRASVNVVARKLQTEKLITYSRGKITILSRKGLEKSTCKCYQTVKDQYDKLLGAG